MPTNTENVLIYIGNNMADPTISTGGAAQSQPAVQLKSYKGGTKIDSLKTDAEKSIFKKMDVNNDGVVDEQEIENYNKSLNSSDSGIQSAQTAQTQELSGGGASGTGNTSYTNANGDLVTEFRDENDLLQRDAVTNQNGDTTETEYSTDGKTPVKSTETTKQGQISTINYNENGEPQTKQVKLGATTSNYTYDSGGNEVLNSKIENEGIEAKERKTEYQYNEDGTVTENVTEYNSTSVVTRNAQGKGLSQTKTVNGQEYTVEYDGEGNTKGIIVQNGESPASIAKKFGVNVNDLTQVNQDVLKGKKYFNVGDEIKIPKELQADDAALQGRKSAEETQADYAQDAQLRQQQNELKAQQRQAQRQAELKSLGIVSTKNAGQKRTGYFGQENLGTRKKSSHTYTVVGQTKNREREIVKDEKGNYHTMAHDGTILDNEYVKKTNLYDSGPKVKGQVKDKNGKTVTNNYVVVGNLSHGRKSVIDEKGQTHVMSADGKILSADYLQKSQLSDDVRSADRVKAQNATVTVLKGELANAQAAFDAQMDKDGWAADVADGFSNVWGVFQKDGNQAWRVRNDLKKYEQNLTELEQAANQGDAQFKTKFKQIYGVDYNPKAIAEYNLHRTDANYKKAFGTKNDIGTRVAKYNSSQDTGAAVVKTTAVVGGSVALTIATGGAGAGIAGTMIVAGTTTAASSFVVNASDSASSHNGMQKLKNGDYSDIKQAGKTALEDGALAAVGGGVGKAVKGLAVVGSTTKAAGKTTKVLTSIKVSEKAAKVINTSARVGASMTADVAAGAAREYVDTGEVTMTGTLTNAAVAAGGQLLGSGVAANLGNKVKNGINAGYQKAKSALHAGNPSSGVRVNTNAAPQIKVQAETSAASGAKPAAGGNSAAPTNAAAQAAPAGSSSAKFNLNQPFDDALSSVGNIKSQAELNEAFGSLQSNKTLTVGQKQAMSRALVDRRKALTSDAAQVAGGKVKNTAHARRADFERGQEYQISDNAKLNLAGACEVDLRNPQIRAKLNNLKPGEKLTIGRDANADIVIDSKYSTVSRQQALIGKDADGNLILEDTSANGTYLASGTVRALSTYKGEFLRKEGKKLAGQEIKQEAQAMQDKDDENDVHQA